MTRLAFRQEQDGRSTPPDTHAQIRKFTTFEGFDAVEMISLEFHFSSLNTQRNFLTMFR